MASTTRTRKKLIVNTVAVSLGCSSSCRRPKLSFLFHPRPKPKKQIYQQHPHPYSTSSVYNSSSSSREYYNYDSATTFSPNTDDHVGVADHHYSWDTTVVEKTRPVRGFGRVGGESVAVEKDSDDPYLDFRQSMLQMILEKELYSKDDLKELLNCFLQLNAPSHHEIIVRAFTEIWNGVFSVSKSAPAVSASSSNFDYGFNCRWMSREFWSVLHVSLSFLCLISMNEDDCTYV